MSHSAKWTVPYSAADAAGPFLRDVVASRMQRVRRFALLAANHSEDDWEYVHQLRVATRRAVVSLHGLDGFATPDERRRIRRGLKRLRRLAGDARDLDVRLKKLLEGPDELSPATRYGLVHAIVMERGQTQKTLVAGVKKFRRKHRLGQWLRWARKLEWRNSPPEPTCHQLATQCLAESSDRLHALGCPWPHETSALHQLRMLGKRTRYECELFASFFAADQFDAVYAELLELQDDLGGWHDDHMALDTWRRWADGPPRSCSSQEITAAARSAAKSERATRAACSEKWSNGRLDNLIARLRGLLGSA